MPLRPQPESAMIGPEGGIQAANLNRGKNMHVRKLLLSLGAAALLTAPALRSAAAAPFLIVGNDEKLLWDDQGKPVVHPAGKDTVVIYDLADPENPKALA